MIERLSMGCLCDGLTNRLHSRQQMISKHIAYLVRALDCDQDEAWTREVCARLARGVKTVRDWAISYADLERASKS